MLVSLIQELVACEKTVIWKSFFPDASRRSLMMCVEKYTFLQATAE